MTETPALFKEFEVSEDIQTARRVPSKAYTEKYILDWEMDYIFDTHWLLLPELPAPSYNTTASVGLVEQLASSGYWVNANYGNESLLFVRDYHQNLHCYQGTCTHAGYPLIGTGKRSAKLTCFQHGRTWHCQGKCTGHDGFNKKSFTEDHDLIQFYVEQWRNKFLFINLTKKADGAVADDFDDVYGPMMASVVNMPIEQLKRRPHSDEERTLDLNFKLPIENFLDLAHLLFIHPIQSSLAGIINLPSYTTTTFDYSVLQWAYAKDPNIGLPLEMLPKNFPADKEHRPLALWWFVKPNQVFMYLPWGVVTYNYIPVQNNPLKTIFYWHEYSWDDALYERREELYLHSIVNKEDVVAMLKVMSGIDSRHTVRGTFGENEIGPHWYHRLWFTTIFGP